MPNLRNADVQKLPELAPNNISHVLLTKQAPSDWMLPIQAPMRDRSGVPSAGSAGAILLGGGRSYSGAAA